MAFRVRVVRDVEEYRAAVGAIGHYFGWEPSEEDAERFAALLPHERMHAVFDDGRIVAGAASESPICRTLPSLTRSAIAPTVSSIGVSGSTRCR